MAQCLNYNCDTLEDHESFGSQCLAPRSSGFGEAVFILCNQDLTDPSDGTEVNALINGGDAKLVQVISAGLDSAEPVVATITASPCRQPQTMYVNYSGSITDLNVTAATMTFWTRLIGGYTIGGMILRFCEQEGYDDQSLYLDGEITFSGSPVFPKEGTETARYEITFTFRGTPEIIDTPQGVFE